jgi:NADH-quinone oxidoreductase subunit A
MMKKDFKKDMSIMSEELLLAGAIVMFLVILLPTLFLLSARLGPSNKKNKAKNTVYESGISTPVGNSENRFSAKFYLIAILFVLFDVEIIFMFPWAINVRELGYFGLFEMFTFIALLVAGLIYIYRVKALAWQ